MSTRTTYVLAGAAGGILAWWLLNGWIALLIILGVIAAPVVGYFMLDPHQRRRLHRIRGRQLNR